MSLVTLDNGLTDEVSETGIEPSYVGIGQKLVSVDQKTSTTMVVEYPTL